MSGGCRLETAFWALNINFLMKIIADFTLSVPKMVKEWKRRARILCNTILYLANVGLTIKLIVEGESKRKIYVKRFNFFLE